MPINESGNFKVQTMDSACMCGYPRNQLLSEYVVVKRMELCNEQSIIYTKA